MNRATLALLAFPLVLLAAPLCPADEANKQARIETPKEKFHVYGGFCSRSIRLQGTYEEFGAACEAAEKCRKDLMKYVTVRTGAHERGYFGRDATQYKVYSFGCRIGWRLNATVENADRAQEIADQLKKDGSRFEIVLHYVPK